MHILATSSATLDDLVEPVDLGQQPGEMAVLSFTDSDLGALARAYRAGSDLGADRDSDPRQSPWPSLRLVALRDLRHPMSVDLWIDRVGAHAKVVVVRLLGGLDWWRYGVERLAAVARARGIALAVLPGEDRDDPRLVQASTVSAAELEALLACFRAGGPDNMRGVLHRMAGLAGRAVEAPAPAEVPLAGLYAWRAKDGRARPAAPAGEGGSSSRPVIPVIFYRSMWLADDTAPVDALCAALHESGLAPRPVFVASLREPHSVGFLQAMLATCEPAAIVTLTAFAAGDPGEPSVLDGPRVPVLQAIVATTRREAWQQGARGLAAADLAMHVVLPELDGRVLAGALSFKVAEPVDDALGYAGLVNAPEPDRVAQLAARVLALVRLQRIPRAERRVAVLLPDYAGAPGRTGWAVGLDVPASVAVLLKDLREAGYGVDAVPEDGAAVLDGLAPARAAAGHEATTARLSLDAYARHFAALPPAARAAVLAAWGDAADDPDVRGGAFGFRARAHGKVVVALAPDRGRWESRRSDYHDPTLPPRHALLAFGFWLRQSFGADALVHMGAHGTLEWLPGKHVALTRCCFPELVLGAMPVIYPFIVSNPGEAAQAKRRIAALTLGHLPPPLVESGPMVATAELERLIDEYAQADGLDRRRREILAALIIDEAARNGIGREAGAEPSQPDTALQRIDAWLCDIKELRLKDGFHIYGRSDCGTAERDGLLAALDGRAVPAGPAGAPHRGRTDVLPTGRNLYTADPRTLPTATAYDLGRVAADEVVRAYLQAHGEWPRALVLDLWGSASLRTGGEEIAHGLALLGCRPVWDAATARVTGVEVLAPAMLGRPRIDVTFRISGLFRDLFPAQVALLDAAIRAVAARDEDVADNPLKAAPEAPRIYGSAPGAYGAGVEDLLGRAQRDAIGAAYLSSASHAYGGAEGEGRAETGFAARVGSADIYLHASDDPGRDLLEGDADLAFIGGFAAAAARLGASAELVVLDTTEPTRPKARSLGQMLARVVRGRTHPRYLAGLVRHGPRGAAEIVETVDRLIGFAETTEAVPSHLIDLLHDAFIDDQYMNSFLSRVNPEGARVVAARFAAARAAGHWHPRRNDVEAGLAALARMPAPKEAAQ